MNKKATFYVKLLLLIIGIFLLFDSIGLLSTGYNSSKLFSGLFGVVFLFISFVWKVLEKSKFKRVYKTFLVMVSLFLASLIIVEGILLTSAHREAGGKDAVIVLGAGLRGSVISYTLADRLDTAYSYLKEHPNMIAVVSGGQGPDEDMTEAEAMRGYLVDKGIAESRILMEDQSTSTFENFKFSKVVLDAHFKGKDYSTAYITNTFHVYRAGLIAEKAGIPSEGVSAPTVWYTRVNYYLREYLAVLKFYVLGR